MKTPLLLFFLPIVVFLIVVTTLLIIIVFLIIILIVIVFLIIILLITLSFPHHTFPPLFLLFLHIIVIISNPFLAWFQIPAGQRKSTRLMGRSIYLSQGKIWKKIYRVISEYTAFCYYPYSLPWLLLSFLLLFLFL